LVVAAVNPPVLGFTAHSKWSNFTGSNQQAFGSGSTEFGGGDSNAAASARFTGMGLLHMAALHHSAPAS